MKPIELTPKQKVGVREFYDNWKRAGCKVGLLEEGLRYLSSDSREPAFRLLESGAPVSDLCCSYGKGPRPKLSLSKEEAHRLLGIVVAIREAGADDALTSEMVRKAFEVLLEGALPAGAGSKELLEIIGSMYPKLRQGSLF